MDGTSIELVAEMWVYAEYASQRFLSNIGGGKYYEPLIDGVAFLYVPLVNDEDFAVLMEQRDKIVISFAGTKNVRAWVSNFDPYPLGEGMIHDGFYCAWSFYKEALDRYFRNSFNVSGKDFSGIKKDLWITGHSRGGALAALCARHFSKNRGKRSVCVTFGAPAQGTGEYAREYEDLKMFHRRVVNGYDIVPKMPPRNLGFYHPWGLIHLGQPVWHKWFHKIRDHFYSNYTKAILRQCRREKAKKGIAMMRRVAKRARP